MVSASLYADDLRLAHVLADTVERITTGAYTNPSTVVRAKEDGSLVTQADVETEEVIRSHLGRTRPRDAILGEELGGSSESSRQWVVDPIDGTANFVRGVPVWGTLIALVVDDVPVMGLVAAPALGRRWWAAEGTGAFTGKSLSQARQVHVSDTARLEHAFLGTSAIGRWADEGQAAAYAELQQDVWRTSGVGDFWCHMLVAEGALDAAVEPGLQPWDVAALIPIVTEAGGRCTSIEGADGIWGGSLLSTNGLLHDTLQGRLDV